MNLAAIDIGSNALRLYIVRVVKDHSMFSFKPVEFVRVPLVLGEGVFATHKISKKNEEQFIDVMKSFSILLNSFKVDSSMFCATAALREAENCNDIVAKVKKKLGIDIEVLDGHQEAEMIFNSVFKRIDGRNFLHIDVGGGSTELNLIVKRKRKYSQSFQIGSIRYRDNQVDKKEWVRLRTWVKQYCLSYDDLTTIGTGGNINKLYELSGEKNNQPVSLNKLMDTINLVKNRTVEERINVLKLNPDRAELIVPASDVYLSVMRWATSNKIMVPQVGLKEGIIQILFEREMKKNVIE